jgi:RNA polymerase sigma-70 factor (ECF subfamily)
MSYTRTETVSDMEDKKDHELMIAYRLGSDKAFETLYSRYRRRLFVYAYSLLKSSHEAEEAMHDVFTRLIADADRFCRANNLSAFLFAVCRNHCLNALKSKRRMVARPDFNGFHLLRSGDSHDEAQRDEAVRMLNAVIGGLPPEQREVLVLKVYSGLTFRQIAQTTGQPQGTVATRYRSAIGRIRDAMSIRGEVEHA